MITVIFEKPVPTAAPEAPTIFKADQLVSEFTPHAKLGSAPVAFASPTLVAQVAPTTVMNAVVVAVCGPEAAVIVSKAAQSTEQGSGATAHAVESLKCVAVIVVRVIPKFYVVENVYPTPNSGAVTVKNRVMGVAAAYVALPL